MGGLLVVLILASLHWMLRIRFESVVPEMGIETWQAQSESIRLLDVRSPAEFDRGHIPGSENMSLSTAMSRVRRGESIVPRDGREILVYCDGGECQGSKKVARLLSRQGFKVWVLRDGYRAWKNRARS